MLCSDGLTEHVAEDEILATVEERGAQQACNALLQLTLQRGARDNVTVIVMRYIRRENRTTRWMPNMRMQETDTP